MGEEPTATRFIHEPLPDSTTYIRLLEIQGADSDGHLLCLLTAWPVAKTPDYYALSYVLRKHLGYVLSTVAYSVRYTWGSPTPIYWIFINGYKFPAGENCVDALIQAYSTKASRYFWIDALCIDQNTTQEKSDQVGMMGQIYARSKHVLACVGPHTNDSMSLFKFLGENSLLLGNIHELTLYSPQEVAHHWVRPNPIWKSSSVALQCFLASSPFQIQALASVFITFMKRSYFSRVWILQELYQAPSISICCGMDSRSIDDLLAVSMLVDFLIHVPSYKGMLTGGALTGAHMFSLPFLLPGKKNALSKLQELFRMMRAQRGCLTLATGARGLYQLAEILGFMQSFRCTDPRDRLFGILVLVEWRRGQRPLPDYGKDNLQVAIEVLRLDNRVYWYSQHDAWPFRLSEIFGIEYKGLAMQQAISKRYGGRFMTLKEISMIYDEFVDDTPISRIPEETWCGIQLCNSRSVSKDTPTLGDLRLDCMFFATQGLARRSNCECSSVGDPDHTQRGFEYAPAKPGSPDWLLFRKQWILTDRRPKLVVLWSVNDGRNRALISQASKDRVYEKSFDFHLIISYLDVHWHAEDHLLFGCIYGNLPEYSNAATKPHGEFE